jgi:membrane protein
MSFLKKCLSLTKTSFNIFAENHPIKFASAIAYFSLFALPSMLLIILYFFSIFFSTEAILGELKEQLLNVVGEDGANILVVITENYKEQAEESIWSQFIYSVVIFWLSTQLFRLFQNSLNDLWRVKPDFDNLWERIWMERILTFFLVIGSGVLLFSSVAVEWGLEQLLGASGGDGEWTITSVLVNLITAVLVFLWFSLLYKVLPAVKVEWGPFFVGAAVTSVLIIIGYLLLWEFVVKRDLEDFYDVVASIIVVALWIFYSSLAFLFGASFTKAYSYDRGKPIKPASYAYKFKEVRDNRNVLD